MFKKAYHIKDGETEMYEVDANTAIREYPLEWAEKPWAGKTREDLNPAASTSEFTAPYEARDKGQGWWAIFDSRGAQIGQAIRKPDAESFNAMSEEDKAEYVKAELAKA